MIDTKTILTLIFLIATIIWIVPPVIQLVRQKKIVLAIGWLVWAIFFISYFVFEPVYQSVIGGWDAALVFILVCSGIALNRKINQRWWYSTVGGVVAILCLILMHVMVF